VEHRIEHIEKKLMTGKRLLMSFSSDRTRELWQSFMPVRKEITNCKSIDLYSMQIYPLLFFHDFNPDAPFEKWAAIEVEDHSIVPEGMETCVLPGGLYAVFLYRGSSSAASETFRYILGTWLPASEYILDLRPHFEILGEKYKNDDPGSEEEIWIPIKPREWNYRPPCK